MKVVTPLKLDVREDIQRGREPFAKIMQAATSLKPGQDLLVIAPFEPRPLFAVLAAQGFSHQSRPLESGDWEVRFSQQPAEMPLVEPPTPAAGNPGTRIEVDARGLQPPEPMVKILEALVKAPGDAEVLVTTDRRPMHLYEQLMERGWIGETTEAQDGSYLTRIHRA